MDQHFLSNHLDSQRHSLGSVNKMDVGVMLGIGHAFALLTYTLGVLIQATPVPFVRIKLLGPMLVTDAILGEVGLASVSLIDALVKWISSTLQQTIGSPFNYSPTALTAILAQLSSLDAAMILLIGAVSSTVILAPVAGALSSMMGSALYWMTVAIVVWLILQTISVSLPSIWITVYVLGLVFFALPLRLGRSFGTMLMSSSMVLAVGLPLAPSIAIWLETTMGYEGVVNPFQNLVSEIFANPLKAPELISNLPMLVGNLFASVVLPLVIFPFAYLFILSLIIKDVSKLLGGAASSPSFNYILSPAYQAGSAVRRKFDE